MVPPVLQALQGLLEPLDLRGLPVLRDLPVQTVLQALQGLQDLLVLLVQPEPQAQLVLRGLVVLLARPDQPGPPGQPDLPEPQVVLEQRDPRDPPGQPDLPVRRGLPAALVLPDLLVRVFTLIRLPLPLHLMRVTGG